MAENFLLVLLSVVYGAIILGVFQIIFIKKLQASIFKVYFFYVILSILYNYVNVSIMPDFKGFTGGFRIGTDDCRFFLQIVDVQFSLPVFCHSLQEIHNFSKFLDFLYPFEIRYPIQIVPFNCIGIAMIPYLGKNIFKFYFPKEPYKIRLIYLLLVFSPTILQNGIILMRDGWTTQFFLIFIYCLLYHKSIILLLVSAGIVALLRPTFIIFPILFYIIETNFEKPNFYRRMLLASLVVLPISYFVLKISKGIDLSEGLVRDEYVEGFLGQFGEESMLYRIMTMPFPINIILSFIFFLTSPFLKWGFSFENILVVRKIFTFIEAVLMTLLIPNFLLNFFKNWKSDNAFKRIALFAMLSLLLLSTISMQARHKLIILPILYILFIYSLDKKNRVFIALAAVYAIFQLLI